MRIRLRVHIRSAPKLLDGALAKSNLASLSPGKVAP